MPVLATIPNKIGLERTDYSPRPCVILEAFSLKGY